VWITEDKTTLEKPRRKWEDIFKMHLQGMGQDFVQWFNIVEGTSKWRAFVLTVMKFQVE
jgi:hypothetical protein